MRFLREREGERERKRSLHGSPFRALTLREQQQQQPAAAAAKCRVGARMRAEKRGGWPFPGKRGWAPVPQGLLTWGERERGPLSSEESRLCLSTPRMSTTAVAKHTAHDNHVRPNPKWSSPICQLSTDCQTRRGEPRQRVFPRECVFDDARKTRRRNSALIRTRQRYQKKRKKQAKQKTLIVKIFARAKNQDLIFARPTCLFSILRIKKTVYNMTLFADIFPGKQL